MKSPLRGFRPAHGSRGARQAAFDLLRETLRAAIDAAILADEAGTILFLNAKAERLFGASASIVGRTMAEAILPARDRAQHEAGLSQALRNQTSSGLPATLEIEGLTALGGETPIILSIAMIPIGEGMATIAYARPSEKTKQSASEPRGDIAGLRHDADAKERFLAVMSHELRTPLTGVLGALDLLGATPLTARQRELADIAARSANALLAIMSDIIEMAHSTDGHWQAARSEFNLYHVAADVIAMVAPYAGQKQNKLTMRYPSDLAREFVGDQTKIRQVILNLLTNAAKFTSNGAIDLDIVPTRTLDGRIEIEISVSDTGQGISEEDHHRLFREFSQIDLGYRRHADGNGLGLAISKRLVEAMDGEIGFHSSPAKGSRFWFRIILEISAKRAQPAHGGPIGTLRPTDDPMRLLVVDDNETVRLIVQSLLTSMGHAAMVADGAIAAIDLMRQRRFDAIFMDISMPGIDGIEAMKLIRELPGATARTPIVALTGHALGSDRERFLAAGADYYLPKPVSLPALQNILAMLQGRSAIDGADAPIAGATEVSPILEESVLEILRDAVPPDDLAQIFAKFGRDLSTRKAMLLDLGALDPNAIRPIVHSLSGSSSSLGARMLSDLAHQMDQAANLGDDAALIRDLPRLIAAIDRTAQAIQNRLTQWSASERQA